MSSLFRNGLACVGLWVVVLVTAAASGCASDDDATTPNGAANLATTCGDMCTKTGFSSSRLAAEANETNCFCTGPGTVTPEACTTFCSGTGKPGSVFKSPAAAKTDACQCQ